MNTRLRTLAHLLAAVLFACGGGGDDVTDVPPTARDAGAPAHDASMSEPECISLESLAGGYRWVDDIRHGDNPAICTYVSCNSSLSAWNAAMHISEDGTLRMALKFVNTYGSTSSLYIHLTGELEITGCDSARLVNIYDYADGCYTGSRHIGSWGTDPVEIDSEHPTMNLRLITLGRALVMVHPLDWFGGKFPWERSATIGRYDVDRAYDEGFVAPRCDPVAPDACRCDCLEVTATCEGGDLAICIPETEHVVEDCDDVCAQIGYGPSTGCTNGVCQCEFASCTPRESTALRCTPEGEAQMCVAGRWVDRSCETLCKSWGYDSTFGCNDGYCQCNPARCQPEIQARSCWDQWWLKTCNADRWWQVQTCESYCLQNGHAGTDGCVDDACLCN